MTINLQAIKTLLWTCIGSVLLMLSSLGYCQDDLTGLQLFLAKTEGQKASFEQSVTDRQGNAIEEVYGGTLVFQRPGKFYWRYEKPYEQEIVSDGKKIWFYDVDLAQVIIQSVQTAMPYTPTAFLFGKENDWQKTWIITPIKTGVYQGWLKATPKTTIPGIEKVHLKISPQGVLEAICLFDPSHQVTRIEFKQWEAMRVDQTYFTFKIPQGVDVNESP